MTDEKKIIKGLDKELMQLIDAEMNDPVIGKLLNKDKFKEKIDELGCLKLDWDGRGACPIMPESLNNLIKLKECYGDWNFDLWQISPGVNGDIYLNFKKGLAAIIIYSHLYSWFTENTNKLYGSANLMFDAETVCNLMKKIEKNEINNN